MSDESRVASRRAFFGRIVGREGTPPIPTGPTVPPEPPAAPAPRQRPRPGERHQPARAGTFAIAEHLCIAWRGTSCSTCRERCPVEGAILVEAGRPTIDPAVCTACGDCVAVCPAPILAIRFTANKPIA
jgi:ferredoxin